MSFLTYEELRNSDHPLSGIAQTFVGAACGIRRLEPYLWLGGDPARALSFPFTNSIDRFWDRICAPPAPVTPGFRPIGGQCPGIIYDLQLYDPAGNASPWQTSTGGGGLAGPIRSVQFTLVNPDPAGSGRFSNIAAGFTDMNGVTRGRSKFDPTFQPLYDSSWSVELVRSDGLPDTCITPPPPPPPVPPPTIFNIPITINNIRNNYEVTLPDLDTGNWPDFTFAPTFQIGDIVAEFTLGGINFPALNFPDWPETPLVDVDLTPTINAIANLDAVLQVGLGNLNVQIGNIGGSGDVDLTEIEALIRCCACEDGVTYEPAVISTGTSGGAFVVPDNCIAISFIASMPLTPSTPTISRSGNEDDKFLWGTVAVGYALGTAGVSQRLSYQSQSIPVSENAKTVTVTPHYQNTCSIIGIIKVKDCI